MTKKTCLFFLLFFVGIPLMTWAQEPTAAKPAPGDDYQVVRYVLAGMCVLLFLVIAALGSVVGSAGKMYGEKTIKKTNTTALTTLLLLLLPLAGFAEEPAVVAAKTPGIPLDIYLLFFLLALELVIILVMVRMLLHFLATPATTQSKKPKEKPLKNLFQKINQTVSLEEEQNLDLAHDYDGIRELDNKVPAWWRYAFYASMVFAVVYIYRMFISETLPTQFQELEESNRIAVLEKAAFLKNAANNVDEHNVTMLDESGIAEGAMLYDKNCLACHGDKGQGGVGPNLTDAYWLHKGGIKDIFHSIKYGWPEKGMKAWKDDFSPAQIAQLASFIKSIKGTTPAGAKEPQGEAYTDEMAITVTDSSSQQP